MERSNSPSVVICQAATSCSVALTGLVIGAMIGGCQSVLMHIACVYPFFAALPQLFQSILYTFTWCLTSKRLLAASLLPPAMDLVVGELQPTFVCVIQELCLLNLCLIMLGFSAKILCLLHEFVLTISFKATCSMSLDRFTTWYSVHF